METQLSEYKKKFDLTKTLEESDIEKIAKIRDSALEKITNSENDKELFDDCNNLLKEYYMMRLKESYSKDWSGKEGIEYGFYSCIENKIVKHETYEKIKSDCYKLSEEIYNFCNTTLTYGT